MQWEAIPSVSGNEVYHLSENNKKILTLSCHPFAHSARVECEGEKRVFLIRKEGFRRNKTVLRSEYGVKIGELGAEGGRQFIDVHEDRIFYTISVDPNPQIILFKESESKPLLVCGMNKQEGKSSVDLPANRNFLPGTYPGLLMALCWYMLLPVTPKSAVAIPT